MTCSPIGGPLLGLACVLALSTSAQAQVAEYPFFDGFEAAQLSDVWTTEVPLGVGTVEVVELYGPHEGQRHLLLHGNPSAIFTVAAADLTIDLAGRSGVFLDFAHKELGDEDQQYDGIWVSMDGIDYQRIHGLTGLDSSPTYRYWTLDLDAAVAAVGFSYTSEFHIRLGWADNQAAPLEGFLFDSFAVRPKGYATLEEVPGNQAGGEFGGALTGILDLNADGHADYAVGHPGFQGGTGRVELLSGKDSSLIKTIELGVPGERLGSALANLGDLDGDGRSELLVGAPSNDTNGPNAGAAYVFSTRTGARLHSFFGQAAQDALGEVVGVSPDLTGDGLAELLVAAPMADTAAGVDAGRVEVFSGSDFGLLFPLEGYQAGAAVGAALDAGHDLDGDGIGDFLVGAPGWNFLISAKDQVGAVLGFSGLDGSIVRIDLGTESKGEFGGAVAFAGDVDGDGTPDFLVGAPSTASNTGRVSLVSGASGVELYADMGREAGDHFGARVTRVGDMNGDQIEDVAVGCSDGSYGTVRIYCSPTWTCKREVEWIDAAPGFGSVLAGAGDINADGLGDLLVGSPFEQAGTLADAGFVRVISAAGLPSVSSVEGLHCTLSGEVVLHGENLLANLVTELDGVPYPATFVSPIEARIGVPVQVPGGFHDLRFTTDQGGETLVDGVPRYPALKLGDPELGLGQSALVSLDNGEAGAWILGFSNQQYGNPAPFTSWGWYHGLELNGVWLLASGTFSAGDTLRELSLTGPTWAPMVGKSFHLQAWTTQSDLGLSGFSNTVTVTIVP